MQFNGLNVRSARISSVNPVNALRKGLIPGSVALFLLVSAISAFHRPPWSDEGWFSSAAYNLAHHGFMGTTVLKDSPGLLHIERTTYWVMPLFLVCQAAWYVLMPESVFFTRIFSIVWGLVGLWSFRRLLARLFPGQAVAGLGMALLATSYIYIDNSAFARPDVACVALGLLALALYLDHRETSLNRAMLLANTSLAASAMMHPNAIYHAAALGVAILWLDLRRIRWSSVALAVVPYIVAAAAWGIYISLDVHAFQAQVQTNGAANDRLPNSWSPQQILLREIRERYFVTFGLVTGGLSHLKLFALAAYAAALVTCLAVTELRRAFAVKLLLAWTGVYFVCLSVFNQKLSYYLVHIVPMYIALLAVAVRWIWDKQPRARRFTTLIIAGLVLLETGGIAARAALRSNVESQRTMVGYVRAQTPAGGSIAGSAALLYEMDFDDRLRDDPRLGVGTDWTPDVIVIESIYRDHYAGWGRLRPAVMARIRARLAEEYRIGYREGEYEVYVRADGTQ